MDHAGLRPIERRMLKLAHEGAGDVEIAWRFRCTPKTVRQVMACSRVPRDGHRPASGSVLRPIERRVLRWREQGAGYEEVAAKFRRGVGYVRQVEQLAHYKLAR